LGSIAHLVTSTWGRTKKKKKKMRGRSLWPESAAALEKAGVQG